MTTSEVEALERLFREAVSVRSGVEAVARAVRAQDEARGGVMTVDALASLGRLVADPGDFAPSVELVASLLAHAAAQGRTIAELEADARLGRELVALLMPHAGSGGDSESAVECLSRLLRERGASESAHDTLRQAAQHLRALWHHPDRHSDAEWFRAAEPVLRALDATPAEHPDTATLRAIRERARRMREDRATWRESARKDGSTKEVCHWDAEIEVIDLVLGDSGPSGGGGKCRACGNTEPNHDPGARLLEPATPPDVAASEHPVDRAAREGMKRGGEKWAAGGMDGASDAPMTDEQARALCAEAGFDVVAGLRDTMALVAERTSEPKPTPEEDWRTVENAVASGYSKKSLAWAALSRLKAEPRRAAEAMRERCAEAAQRVADRWLEADARNEAAGSPEIAERCRMRAQVAVYVRQELRTLPL